MGFESWNSAPVPPQENEPQIENPVESTENVEAEKEKMLADLENEKKSIQYCEKTIVESIKDYEKYSKLANGPSSIDFMLNKKKAENALAEKTKWEDTLREHMKIKSDLEEKLKSLE